MWNHFGLDCDQDCVTLSGYCLMRTTAKQHLATIDGSSLVPKCSMIPALSEYQTIPVFQRHVMCIVLCIKSSQFVVIAPSLSPIYGLRMAAASSIALAVFAIHSCAIVALW